MVLLYEIQSNYVSVETESTTFDRKRICANPSAYPNPNSNSNSNTNPNPNPNPNPEAQYVFRLTK